MSTKCRWPTAATIGTVAIPEMTARGYDRPVVLWRLAAGGTLGILIPPSIPMILYGVVTETSIPTLFLAGIGPGLFLAGSFLVYGLLYSRFKGGYEPLPATSWSERWRTSLLALPTVVLAAAIIGAIYSGIATPSESAGVGFVLALAITGAMKRMTWEKLKDATHSALRTTVMIFLIVAGAKVFSYAITLYLIPQSISQVLTTNISDPNLFILAVGVVLLIIGFFLEALSMLLIMVPVLFPSLEAMAIDPIWFGVFFVILIETALITPPVGLNLFVIQAVGNARLEEVMKGAWPFSLIMLGTAALLWFWKDLALFVAYGF